MESIKEKMNKQILFTASRKGQDLKVYQMEKDGQIRYGLSLDKKEATPLSRENLLKELDFIGWSDWKAEAKDLMRDFSLGMAVLDRIRIEQGRESWRTWIRSAGWLQATILGNGAWGEKLIDLLADGSLNRFGTLGVISDPTILSEEDQVRILLVDSPENISPEVEKWIRGNGQSLSFILTPKLPEKMEIPALWLEISPGEFLGGLEELLYELLEGCCPFGLINNGFSELLPYFQRPYEGIGKMIWSDEEDWLETITEDILGNVGWESKWGKSQVLFLLIQASHEAVDPAHLLPLSLAIRQGVSPTCRVMASVRENGSWKSQKIRILLVGMNSVNDPTAIQKGSKSSDES